MTHTKAAIEELGIILAEPSSTFPVATSEPFSASLLPDLPQESLTGFLLGTRNSAMPNYSESPRAFASKVIRLLDPDRKKLWRFTPKCTRMLSE
jgi:hypothetical protein